MAAETSTSAQTILPERPSKPDQAAYDTEVGEARKNLDKANDAQKAAQARVNALRPENRDPAAIQKEQELKDRQASLKKDQSGISSRRTALLDQIKAQETAYKGKQNELKNNKSSIPFKSTADIDAEIKRLQASVDSGSLKLVEERKTLDQISGLHRQRKVLANLEGQQGTVDEGKKNAETLRAQLKELDKSKEQAEWKEVQGALDVLFAEKKEQFAKLNKARDDLKVCRDNQDAAYKNFQAIRDKWHKDQRAYRDHEREVRKQRDERYKAEREKYAEQKRKEQLKERIDEAEIPAYGEEIRAAEALLRLLDPTNASASADAGPKVSAFAAQAQRTVDAGDLKGARVMKKDDDDAYFIGGGGKKKKGPKAKTDSADKARFGQITMSQKEFDLVGVAPPASPEEIEAKVTQIKEKKAFFLADRKRKTAENVEKAKKDFEAVGGDTKEEAATNGDKPANGEAATA